MSRLETAAESARAAGAGAADTTAGGSVARRLKLPLGPDSAPGSGRSPGARNSAGAHTDRASEGNGQPSRGRLMAARLGGLALGMLVSVLLAAAGLAMVWFDLSGLRQTAVRTLKLDQASWVILEERRAALDKATAELAAQKRAVDDERARGETAAASLQKQGKDLEAREAMIEERTRQLTGHELSLQSLVAVYEGMDPAKAAAMVAAAGDRRQAATILKAVSQARLSLILEQMPASVAAELVALMTPDLTKLPAPAPTTASTARPTGAPTGAPTARRQP